MSEKTNNTADVQVSDNSHYTSISALKLRLDVEPLLAQLEMDVRGLRETWNSETQKIELVKISDALFKSEVGVNNYMSFVRSVVNNQVVQGNLDEDSYADYMYSVHERLARDLMINRYKYGLDLSNYGTVISFAMNTIRGFLTRPIGDRERGSYAQTLKQVESNSTVTGRSGGFFDFKK